MNIKQHIPNLLTLGNLLCGCLAIILLLEPNLLNDDFTPEHWGRELASGRYPNLIFALIGISLFFDVFDGLIARALNVSGELGKQLDSLADAVSFGVLPSLLMLYLFKESHKWGTFHNLEVLPSSFSLICLVLALAAVYRLAKFNLLEDTSSNFKGLPTPAMTIFVIGSFYWLYSSSSDGSYLIGQLLIIGLSIALSVLMISNLPLFSFKFKNFTWKDNWFRYLLILIAIPLLIWLKLAALPIIILIYILLSILFRKAFHPSSEIIEHA